MGITGDNGSNGGSGSDTTFLFRTFGINIRVTTDDLDLLRRL